MSKIRNRFSPTEQNGLQDAWDNLLKAFDDYAVQRADCVLAALRRSISNKINGTAGSFIRLDGFDEKAYEYHKSLMEHYENIVNIYNGGRQDVTSRQLKNILGGIYAILSSSLQESKAVETSEQPIQTEKKDMILNAISGFLSEFDGLSIRYKQSGEFGQNDFSTVTTYARERLFDGFTDDSTGDVARYVFYSIKDIIGKSCYGLFSNTVVNCDLYLNDLDARHVASYYFKQLDKEYSILNSLIVTQIRAIESNTRGKSAKEVLLAHRIMQALREAYQYFGRNVVDVLTYFKTKQPPVADRPPVISEEAFLEEIFNAAFESCVRGGISEDGFKAYSEAVTEWREELVAVLESILHSNNVMSVSKAAYRMHRMAAEYNSMATDMIAAFEKILMFYKENENLYEPCIEYEIISGINETIGIKIESLAENKKLFSDDMLSMIGALSKLKTSFTKEEISAQVNQAVQIWKDCFIKNTESYQTSLEMFEQRLKDSEANKSKLQTFVKSFNAQEDRIVKKINEFLKTQILFEASTFEEIINYSVSHLENSEAEPVKAYYEHIGSITKCVETILKKNNIEMINPEPHDLFNGKEHEVLMAEINKEFKKGEIIKLMNSGYKQNDTVLLRANVIAAK